MKNTRILILGLFCTMSIWGLGQDTLSNPKLGKRMVVKINPLFIGMLSLNLHTEMPVGPKNAITFSLLAWPPFLFPYGFTGMFYGGAQLGYRRYFKVDKRSQYFYEGFARFNLIHDFKDTYSPGGVGSRSIGLVLGKQWEYRKKGVIELFVGPYYANSFPLDFDINNADPRSVSSKTVKEYGPFNGFWLRAGFLVGRRF